MKKIVLGYFILFIFSVSALQAQEPRSYSFTLEQCLEYAFGNNLTRQNMLLSEEMKEDSYNQSKKERLPSVSASLSESFSYENKKEETSFNGDYGLDASMILYQGGSITNTIEKSKLTMEQSRYQTQQYDNEMTIQILQAFLTVLGNEELLKYQRAVVAFSEEQLSQGKAQYGVGSILESDYLLLEAQYSTDKANITDTEITRTNSLLTLKNLLSMDPEANLGIVYPDATSLSGMMMVPTQESVVQQALVAMPDLKISQFNVDIAGKNIQVARSGYLPTLSLSGGINTGHSKNFQNWGTQVTDKLGESLRLSLSIPIFDKGRTKSNVTQAKIALQQAEYDQIQADLTLRQTVSQGYQDVISALNRYQSYVVRENAYSKTYDAYRAMFNAGAITAVELLQQQNNYISALNDYIQSKYTFILRRKILDVYMGEEIRI